MAIRGGNIIIVEDIRSSSKSNDGYHTVYKWYWPSLIHHKQYRITIDSSQDMIEGALNLHKELLESRTSVYVNKHLDNNYVTEEFIKNRLGQLDQMIEKMGEVKTAIEIGGSVAFEPIDWILSLNEFVETGNPTSLAMAAIPGVPGTAKKVIKKVPDFRKVNFDDWFDLASAQKIKELFEDKQSMTIITTGSFITLYLIF